MFIPFSKEVYSLLRFPKVHLLEIGSFIRDMEINQQIQKKHNPQTNVVKTM